METKFTHACELKGSTVEIAPIILWLGENYNIAPHTFSCGSYTSKDYRSSVETYIVTLNVKFSTIEGATSFKLRWMNEEC